MALPLQRRLHVLALGPSQLHSRCSTDIIPLLWILHIVFCYNVGSQIARPSAMARFALQCVTTQFHAFL
eukprot:2606837-Pyramimonas_sp.AAC.1